MESKLYTFNAFSTAKGCGYVPTACEVLIGKGFARKIMLTARYVRDNELLNAAQFVHAIWRNERGEVVSTDFDQVLVYESNFVFKAVTRSGNLAITSVSCKVDQLAMDFGLRIVPVPETTVEGRNRVLEIQEESPNTGTCPALQWLILPKEEKSYFTNFGDGRPGDASALAKQINEDPSWNRGFTDWRLPTLDELKSIRGQEDEPTMPCGFWSSSGHEVDATEAWCVDFYGFFAYHDRRESKLAVRLVRDRQ